MRKPGAVALAWIVVLLAALGVAWLAWEEGLGGAGAPRDLAVAPAPGTGPDTGAAGAAGSGGPVLEGGDGAFAGGRRALWVGSGGIVGVVTQDGTPAEAAVEVRQVYPLDEYGAPPSFWRRLLGALLDPGAGEVWQPRARSGPDGRYEVTDLAPGTYEVRALGAQGRGRATAALPARGARVQADIALQPTGCVLKGRVLDAQGAPLGGAFALASAPDFHPLQGVVPLAPPVAVDAEGRFTLTGLPAGPVGVSAFLPGRLHLRGAPVTLPTEEEVVLRFPAGSRHVRGRVVSAASGEPVAGATVAGGAGDPRTLLVLTGTHSDAEGRFELALVPGDGGIFVEARGFAVALLPLRGVTPEEELVVSLEALAAIQGTVRLRGGGAPVAGVAVRAIPRGRDGLLTLPAAAPTDERGRYRIEGVIPGEVSVYALGRGHASVGLAQASQDGFNPLVRRVEPGAVLEVDLEVEPAARAEGRITTAQGEPVVGAVVLPVGTSGVPRVRGGLDEGFGAPQAVSDASGRYQLDALAPGAQVTIEARAAGLPPVRSEPFEAEGGSVRTVDFRFPTPRAAVVTVRRGPGGEAIAGATVRIFESSGQGGWSGGGPTFTTGADGRVRIEPLPEGDLGLAASAPGCVELRGPEAVAIPAGAGPEVHHELVLEPGLPIAGRLLLPTGVPPSALRVTIATAPSSGPHRVHERVVPDAEGRFALALFPRGAHRITVTGEWDGVRYLTTRDVAAGDEGIEVRVERAEARDPGEWLVLRLLDADGRPVASGQVTLHRVRGGARSSSGAGLRGGRAELHLGHVDGAELWLEVRDVPGHAALLTGPLTVPEGDLVVRLERERVLAGVVLGPDGPVPGVRVDATPARLPGMALEFRTPHGQAYADAAGRFEIGGLGDLDYALTVRPPPALLPPAEELVARPGGAPLRIVLRAGAQATLRVLDPAGAPVAEATVSVAGGAEGGASPSNPRRPAGPRAQPTDGEGRVRFQGLDPERPLRLAVQPPAGRTDLRGLTLDPWTPRDETLRLPRAFRIHGRVVDERGQPVPAGAVLYALEVDPATPPTGWTHAAVGPTGEFEIGGLAEGTYLLRAQPPGLAPFAPGVEATRVEAGASGVLLRVELRGVLTLRLADAADVGHALGHVVAAGERHSVRAGPDGLVYLAGLDPEKRYTLVFLGLSDGRCVFETDLVPDGRERALRLRRGAPIEVRVSGAPAGASVRLEVEFAPGVYVFLPARNEDDRWVADGVPEGRWRLRARAPAGGTWVEGTAEGTTGGTVAIALQPAAR